MAHTRSTRTDRDSEEYDCWHLLRTSHRVSQHSAQGLDLVTSQYFNKKLGSGLCTAVYSLSKPTPMGLNSDFVAATKSRHYVLCTYQIDIQVWIDENFKFYSARRGCTTSLSCGKFPWSTSWITMPSSIGTRSVLARMPDWGQSFDCQKDKKLSHPTYQRTWQPCNATTTSSCRCGCRCSILGYERAT